MEAYKQKKEEEAANLKKDGEEFMKLQKQEAMQLLKKKEKTETLIKVLLDWRPLWLITSNVYCILILAIGMQKEKVSRQKKKSEEKTVDPNKPKRPASSYLLFSKETRKSLAEERPGTNNSTITALISLKWKVLQLRVLICADEEGLI